MAECFYYKNGERIDSVQDLIKEFFESTYTLTNAAIYSAEQIQQSTINKILEANSKTRYDDEGAIKVTELIVKEDPSFFRSVGIDASRLSPEYIKESRIHEFVKSKLDVAENYPLGTPYSTEQFQILRAQKDLESIPTETLERLLGEIEGVINFEDKTKDFGNFLHAVIASKIRGERDSSSKHNYKSLVKSFLTNPDNAEIIGTIYSADEWSKEIDVLTDEIIAKVKPFGQPLSEVFIIAKEKNPFSKRGGIRGKIDIITVDDKGDAHIFELKVSKRRYKDWDSAKLLNLDWQLAMYRQLLGQHVRVNKAMLHVIPVWMNGLENPNAIAVETIANRKTESKTGLNTGDKISRWAEKILPTKVHVDYDETRITKLMGQLNELIPNYVIETGIEDYDVQKIMENARKRYQTTKEWKKWNNFDDIENLSKGYIEADTEEEFEKKIQYYVDHVKLQINRNVSVLKDAIISAIKTGTSITTNAFDSNRDVTANHILKEYLNDEWDVVDIPEALAMGLITLKNNRNGDIFILSMSINQFYADVKDNRGKNYGDLELLKSYLFANAFKDYLMPSGSGRISGIMAYNPINNQVYYRNSVTHFQEFKKEMHARNMQDQLLLKDSNISPIEDIALYNLDANLRNFNGADKEILNTIFAKFRDTNLDQIDVDMLIDIQKEFYNKWSDYKNKTLEGKLNFEDPKEVLLALLQVAIASKSHMDLTGDFQRMSKYSLGFSDFYSLIAALYTDDLAKYDKEGRRIQGIVQGLLWTTPDWIASKDLKNINSIMSTSNQHIGEWMLGVSEKIAIDTKEYYKALNFGALSRNVWGETQSKHKNLMFHKNNKVSDEFRTKNPYIVDADNRMEEFERTYLMKQLLRLNTWMLEIPEAQVAKLDPLSLESISTHPKIKAALDKGTYFNLPLVRREELSRFGSVVSNPGKFWSEKMAPYFNEINDYIDSRQLQKGDREILERQKMGYYEMYDIYSRQSPEYVAKGIEKHSVDYFEWNLDTIIHRVAFSKIRKKIYDRKLPIINAYIWWIKLLAGKQNEDISNQLEYIKNQMSLSVYDEPIIDEEFKDFTTVVSVLKKAATVGLLAFKPAAMLKELTIGVFKGLSIAATQVYGKDQFNISDLTKAYGKLVTINDKLGSDFNLIDKLNSFYRFANMDTNTIAKKLQTDRWGLFKGAGRYMFMFNTIPDYYNRLSVFMAKMIHDGSYDAHSIIDGVFTYDATKDERFAYYLANRNKHKTAEGQYIAAKNDEKYNKQRQRYLLLQEQLNNEYQGEKVFTEDNIVNKAYSEIERTSLKSFTDMAYGYYDKDAQSQSNNLWWGIAWLQFMQFWPGKMKMWFATPTDESPMGKVVHDYILDKDKNKILQYHETYTDDNGVIKTRATDVNTGDPIYKWEGAPYEGLWYALAGTLKDIATLDFKHIKGSEERNRRVMFALADAGLMFLMFAFVKALLDAMIEENGTDGLSGTLLNMTSAVNKKVLNEYNVYQSTLGAVNTEPVFLAWGKKMSTDMWEAISGDKEVMDVMTRNVGAAEVFKW